MSNDIAFFLVQTQKDYQPKTEFPKFLPPKSIANLENLEILIGGFSDKNLDDMDLYVDIGRIN